MIKKEKPGYPIKNNLPDAMRASDPRSLKDDPEGETVCSPYFSKGCINEDTNPPAIIKKEDAHEKQ